MTAIYEKSARELATLIASKALSAAEVVEAHLERIAVVNPTVNAIVRVLADEARLGAQAADLAVTKGEVLGPLHGVPFTVKENIDVAGQATTNGVKAFAHAIAPQDAPIIERMRAAGAIPIGRTNLPDFGLRVHTDSSLHGLTRNPWNLGRTAAGSSGGEAAALATGMSPIGLGNDIGGSLRNPASACGIASIRPTNGRVPHAALVPNADKLMVVQLMMTHGPMARTIADVRFGLEILNGAHPRDPWSIDMPLVGRAFSKPIRIAMIAEPPGGTVDPVIADTVRRAGQALAEAGYDVVEICPPFYVEAVHIWAQLIMGDFSSIFPLMMPLIGEDGQKYLRSSMDNVPSLVDAAALSRLFVERDGIACAWSMFMADHPLILSPTWTQLPFEHGYDLDAAEGIAATNSMMRPVVHANLLGLPSACVPAGRDAATGLPIGVLLTGQRFRDDLCLDAAEVVEAKLGLQTPIDPAG